MPSHVVAMSLLRGFSGAAVTARAGPVQLTGGVGVCGVGAGVIVVERLSVCVSVAGHGLEAFTHHHA